MIYQTRTATYILMIPQPPHPHETLAEHYEHRAEMPRAIATTPME